MAIIDHKRLEAEQEQARQRAAEYAARHDSMSAPGMSAQDDDDDAAANSGRAAWDLQPPPAYEEANRGASASTSSAQAQSQPSDRDAETRREEEAHESTPLLPTSNEEGAGEAGGRRGRRGRRWERRDFRTIAKRKLRHAVHFAFAGAIVAGIALVIIFATLKHDGSQEELLPSPPEKDGRPIEMPSWSSPVRLPQDMWPGRYVALYSTKAFFTLPVTEEELFVSAKGAAYSGLITIEDSNSLSDDEWAKLTNHKIYDQMVIEVESRFTEQWLRDGILVRMMQRDHGKGVGLGIYSGSRPFYSPSQFISYHVTVHLPAPKWRRRNSESLRSNTSLIPHVSVNADNMRLAIESLWGRDDQGWTKEGGVYFKTFESQLLNSGLQIARALVASESVTLVLQNGPMRDISADGLRASIVAPSIDVETRNGPIWLTNILASENITLRTGAGGINVTGGARAPLINVRNHGGYIGGCYRAEHLTVTTENGDVDAAVWLTESDGDYDLDLPGDVVGDGKVKNKWSKVRTVEVDSKVSGTHVRYIEQDRSIELHSRISSRLGTIVVEHAPGFQGSWNASTNVGHLTVEGPSDEDIGNGRRIVTDAISEWPVGHWGRGRVWWGDKWHEWKMKGFSHVSSGAGSIRMSF